MDTAELGALMLDRDLETGDIAFDLAVNQDQRDLAPLSSSRGGVSGSLAHAGIASGTSSRRYPSPFAANSSRSHCQRSYARCAATASSSVSSSRSPISIHGPPNGPG